jgi:hypothetical protein
MRHTLILVCLVATVNLGCSFVFSEGPPVDHRQMPYFDCSSNYGVPVADGLFALIGATGAAATLGKSKQEYADQNNGGHRNAAAGVDIGLAVITAVSAAYGVVQATRCAHAKAELQARILGPFPGLHPNLPPPRLPPPTATPAPPAAPPAAAPPGAPITAPPPAPTETPVPAPPN